MTVTKFLKIPTYFYKNLFVLIIFYVKDSNFLEFDEMNNFMAHIQQYIFSYKCDIRPTRNGKL